MELEVRRTHLLERATLGELRIDGKLYGYTCEDRVRAEGVKVYGETAIPCGRYEVTRRQSPTWRKPMPYLERVPGFEGIMFHPGNTASDSKGCILIGRTIDPHAAAVGGSKAAFNLLWARVEAVLLNRGAVHVDIIIAAKVDTREGP